MFRTKLSLNDVVVCFIGMFQFIYLMMQSNRHVEWGERVKF